MAESSRDRILAESLRLFGEQGYAGTSIAQIEQAAGLSPGSGALYRHFKSKDELLVQALQARVLDRGQWAQFLAPDFSVLAMLDLVAPDSDIVDRLMVLCRIGLQRLDHDRDVTRILLRDNTAPQDVLEVVRRDEHLVVLSVLTRGLAELAGPDRGNEDWDALAVVLQAALAHYWLVRDVFGGEHPSTIDPDRYLRAIAEMVAARLKVPATEAIRT
ncbi:TetR/AcrR family transcriptional regulator [Mycobacterium neglectum]|jgi:AcrR family transcriptional regulator|uniref:TetR/AcrR family transcriptional regulator n=1 Tax=Mycobacterium neglectum TaxID=242737 RepID=UPI000BFF01CF|nr:TetR/AcrR family transcriptional regulator [Mycobacterium neglectum]